MAHANIFLLVHSCCLLCRNMQLMVMTWTQDQFYGLLGGWLATPDGSNNRNHLVIAANGTILASQLGFTHTASFDQVP